MTGPRTRGGKKDGVPPPTHEETNNDSEDSQESNDDTARNAAPINILLKKDSPVDLTTLKSYCYVTKNLNNYKQLLPNSVDDYHNIINTLNATISNT